VTYSFPKSVRLRKRSQYQRMAMQAKRHVGCWIIIESRQNQSSQVRLGITVSKKYGKAHDRNRFKRIVREAFRLCRHQLRVGQDLNIRPRSSSKNAKTQDIIQELING
jgi:ribonuclease P protein component